MLNKVGCFSGNVPVYVNRTTGSQFFGDSVIFNSFNSRAQSPSIFNVPSFCNNNKNIKLEESKFNLIINLFFFILFYFIFSVISSIFNSNLFLI